MPRFTLLQNVQKLEKSRGGYYYLKIDAALVEQFEKKRHQRLKCDIQSQVSFSCGLNHYGDGHFFIIIAQRYIKQLGKQVGDQLTCQIYEDPNPLGVEIPEVLKVLLAQDDLAKDQFEKMTDGKNVA